MSSREYQDQAFKTQAFKDGKFIEVSDGGPGWKVVGFFFFYPADFTFVLPHRAWWTWPTIMRSSRSSAWRSTRCPTDTHFTHKAWHDTSETIAKIKYTMLGDAQPRDLGPTSRFCVPARALPDRGTFIVDPNGRHPGRGNHR